MKILLSLLLLISFCSTAHAQNYRCVQANTINYFTNSSHYLRAIRIDSVKDINGDTVLYPFKTARGEYVGSKKYLHKGGSWLGEDITIEPDGTHRFRNYMGDDIIIKTQTALNDSWIFYDDTSLNYYIATVTAIDTMTVLGVVDSVKTITLTAMHVLSVVPTDSLHNRRIVISKNHGFVQTVDLYVFPQQNGVSNDFDYFTEKALNIDFKICDFLNPDKLDVYDFKVGDEFQTEAGGASSSWRVVYTLSQFLQKTNITPSHVQYVVRRVFLKFPKNGPNIMSETSVDTAVIDVHSGLLLDMSKLPEEWGQKKSIKYNENDKSFCTTNKHYTSYPNFFSYFGDSASVNTFEPCGGPNNSYKIGLGGLTYSFCTDPVQIPEYWFTRYVMRNGTPCGNFYYMSIADNELAANTEVSIHPNPASDKVIINMSNNHQPAKLSLYDITGKLMVQKSFNGKSTELSVGDYVNGYYLLRLAHENGSESNHKILVKH